jgi:phosphoribosyl 1,2-cyclic phosphodiesterase
MSLSYTILGSGSKANSYYFRHNDFAFVIDNGFTLKHWRQRFFKVQEDEGLIQFIFLTHAHSDHLRGIEALSRSLNVPVVTHKGMNIDKIFKKDGVSALDVDWLKTYEFGPLSFFPFPLHHDALLALSYHFRLGGKRFTLLTDSGHTDRRMFNLAKRSQILFLESNYCPEMLANGPYPRYLKKRIAGQMGHLSNHQARDFLLQLAEDPECQLEKVYLVHLSETNNHSQVVAKTMQGLENAPFQITICPKNALVNNHEQFHFTNPQEQGIILTDTKLLNNIRAPKSVS